MCKEKVWTSRKTHLTTILFGCAVAWWWLWLFRKWWSFTLTSVVNLSMRGPEHFQPHRSVSLTLSLVSPGCWHPGCFSRCCRFLWAGMWAYNIPLTLKPTHCHCFSLFFSLPREHPSGNADAFCGEAGAAAADVVSAPAARGKRSSQHPQQRGGNACEPGLGAGLPEAAPAFDRVRMIWPFLCWFSILQHAWLCCTLSLSSV